MNDIGILLLLKAINSILGQIKTIYIYKCEQEIMDAIRLDLFKTVVNRDIADFDKYGAPDLSSVVYDNQDLVPMILHKIPNLITNILRFSGAVLLMLSLSTELAMLSIASIPLKFFMRYLKLELEVRRWQQVDYEHIDVDCYLYEVLDSIKNVRAFGCLREEIRKVEDMMDKKRNMGETKGIIERLFDQLFLFVLESFSFVLMIYGGVLIRGGRISVESFLSYQSYHSTFEGSRNTISDEMSYACSVLIRARGAVHSMDQNNKVKKNGVLRPPIKGDLKMENVSFTYPTRPDHIVIQDLNLHINKGDSVALVGRSGAGKSTIISLLERFYTPDSGSITVDGIPIEEIDDEYYHKQVAWVPQEPFLYDRSIKENILYGCDWATEEQMVEAAKLANIHDFIMKLKNGYETKCYDCDMSGGQKQRITIARALVRDPAILLLDEATSALDPESECVVQEALRGCCKDRTVIVIAHRLSSLRNVDKIAVIEKGCLVEHGTHKELMKIENGIYAKLVNLQIQGFALDSIEDALNDSQNMEDEEEFPEEDGDDMERDTQDSEISGNDDDWND